MAPSHSRPHGRRVPSIIVHGGAGAALENAETYRPGIRAAVAAGWAVLVAGGRALDAVEAAVRSLENDERFNAGRGSVLTEAGTVEMDASIMEGDRLTCGAVAAVSRIANPVTLSRRALDYLKEADDPDYAAKVSVDLLVEEGRGEGGLIVVDWRGRIGYAQSTAFMPVGWMTPSLGEPALPF